MAMTLKKRNKGLFHIVRSEEYKTIFVMGLLDFAGFNKIRKNYLGLQF
jgi:hypothetical protein